ncbi:MAG: hypothetical protein HPY44_05875 [Armatimonadetes bacterium]|nr:hypothetical protein [Armatimonadota bacterium]
MTLRQAEELGKEWLRDLGNFVPSAIETSETEPADGDPDHGDSLDTDESAPESIRDCFVDDDWDAQGFKNPTEAIQWLTSEPRKLGRVLSAGLAENACEMTLELLGAEPCKVQVTVVVEDGYAKCRRLALQQ